MDAKMMISAISEDTAKTDFEVHDAFGQLRATVRQDGSVLGARGDLLGYCDASGQVGDVNDSYMGEVTQPRDQCSIGHITDEADNCIGEIDYGTSTIRDVQGSTIAEISRAGEVCGHTGVRCGVLDGFTFHSLRTAAQYLMIVDPQFLKQC